MQCPECGTEVEHADKETIVYVDKTSFTDLMFGNMGVWLGIGLLVSWIIPFDIDHGYSLNWDMVALLVFIIAYNVYAWFHYIGKNKGKLLIKRMNESN